MTPIEKLGVEISDFLEQNALVWPDSLRQAWDAAKDAEFTKNHGPDMAVLREHLEKAEKRK